MKPRAIADNVYWVGVNDYQKDLFEGLWPLPYGVSYNSYAVIGRDAVALIDTVEEAFLYEYIGKVQEVVKDLSRIRYIVLNHLEPDHHGATPEILKMLPNAKVLLSSIGYRLYTLLYTIPKDRVVVVNDGDVLDLGGKRLKFIYTPWLHWPETMMTYLIEDGILFSCDAFGSYGALDRGLFDDELDMEFYIDEAKRYFSNIVMKYSRNVVEAVEKLSKMGIEIKVLAPSHGPVYRSNPKRIIDLYYKWSKNVFDGKRVLVLYGSMYGRTQDIVDRVVNIIRKSNIDVAVNDASRVHQSYILQEIVDSKAVVVLYPSYDASMFPYVKDVLNLFAVKDAGKDRYALVINIHMWTPTVNEAVDMVKRAGFTIVDSLAVKAVPSSEEMERIEKAVLKLIDLLK